MALFYWDKIATTIKRYIDNITEALAASECTLEELEDAPTAEGYIYAQCRKCGKKDCSEIGKNRHSIRYLYRRDGVQNHLPKTEALELLPLVKNRVRKEVAQKVIEKYSNRLNRLCEYLERMEMEIRKLMSRRLRYE